MGVMTSVTVRHIAAFELVVDDILSEPFVVEESLKKQ